MNFPRSVLSHHAGVRLSERFKISHEAFLDLLNAGHGKKIGASRETHLAHRLIWSHEDSQLLVAIQDVIDGTVLTVLTLDMYSRDYEQNVTEGRIAKVINKMVHANLEQPSLWRPGVSGEDVTVYVTVQYWPTKVVGIGKWKGAVESVNLAELGKKQEFWAWVSAQAAARGHEQVLAVEGKFSGGDAQEIPRAV